MSLNESKGNMYDFVTHTWNTVKGRCFHNCSYCYMKKWGKLNPVRFDKRELKTNLGEGNFIFIGSSCDMFAEDIPADWIRDTLVKCNWYDNRYLFQSKNPARMAEWLKDGYLCCGRAVVCTTIESNVYFPDIMGESPEPWKRIEPFAEGLDHFDRYVTVEPILDFDLSPMLHLLKSCRPKQVNIGAGTGNHHLPEPTAEQINELVAGLKEFTKVKLKSNIRRLGVKELLD